MSLAPRRPAANWLEPEKVAYWYFRLNGFFQIENFVIHPTNRGSQRTDADLLAVRFPFRAERLFDDPNDVMADDNEKLSLSNNLVEIRIVEVKRNEPCKLNGPWTRPDDQNMHRVLAAIGCLPRDRIEAAAKDLYQAGCHTADGQLHIRLIAVGRGYNDSLATKYPNATQLLWTEMLPFIWDRLDRYRRQKTHVSQWDDVGKQIKALAEKYHNSSEDFTNECLKRMGVRTHQG